jgi:hypothetical protein
MHSPRSNLGMQFTQSIIAKCDAEIPTPWLDISFINVSCVACYDARSSDTNSGLANSPYKKRHIILA